MTVVWLTLPMLALGVLLCFAGHRIARVALALLGLLVGFWFGSWMFGVLAAGNPGLGEVIGWACQLGGALIGGWLAYTFYVGGVLFLLGSLGWGLGILLAGGFGLSGGLEILAPLAGAALMVVLGLVANLPRLLMIVTTALVGAGLIVAAAQVLLPALGGLGPTGAWLADKWVLVQVLLVLLGLLVQLPQGGKPNLRAAYSSS